VKLFDGEVHRPVAPTHVSVIGCRSLLAGDFSACDREQARSYNYIVPAWEGAGGPRRCGAAPIRSSAEINSTILRRLRQKTVPLHHRDAHRKKEREEATHDL
jgi:hypothetical protein